jgi:hypothetical protein
MMIHNTHKWNWDKHVIESLKSKDSAGYEGISCRILKYCTHAIAKPLSHICTASLNQGIYSDRLKFVTVRLIYKKREKKTDVANYRPNSLITFAKILEKVMYSKCHWKQDFDPWTVWFSNK